MYAMFMAYRIKLNPQIKKKKKFEALVSLFVYRTTSQSSD